MNDDERRSISSLEAEEERLEFTRFDNVDAGSLSSALVVAATGRSLPSRSISGAKIPRHVRGRAPQPSRAPLPQQRAYAIARFCKPASQPRNRRNVVTPTVRSFAGAAVPALPGALRSGLEVEDCVGQPFGLIGP
jgi:hypothetical protein